MCDCRKCTVFLQKWIANLPDLERNQSLETVPVCFVWQYFPHDNVVKTHVCDECMKSIDSGACHRPWSILWLIVQAYFADHKKSGRPLRAKSNWEQFESIDFISSSLKKWSSMRGVDTCFPTHNIVPHTSLHDQPCLMTMKKDEDVEGMVVSLLLTRKFAIRTWFCIVHNIFAYLALSWSASQVFMFQERCWFSQINFSIEQPPHRDQDFVFPANFVSSTCTEGPVSVV